MDALKIKLLEYLGLDDDWKSNELTNQEQVRMVADLKYMFEKNIILFIHNKDVVEVVFSLYRYGKSNKAKFLSNVIRMHFDDVGFRSSVSPRGTLTIKGMQYTSYIDSDDSIKDFDIPAVSDFVVYLSGKGLHPDEVLRKYLNEDILTFMEL